MRPILPCEFILASVRVAAATATVATLLSAAAASPAGAQWINRYPKNAGYAHQVYLEGYELPIIASGPGDAAPSPDGRSIAVASQGWIWLLDPATGVARRVTSGAGVDSRPAWSPDGASLVFVRDDSRTLAVIVRDMRSGRERELDRGMAMDPVFTRDGRAVLYTNLDSGGDLDLRRIELSDGRRTRLTTAAGLELRPQVFPDSNRLLYLSKSRSSGDQVLLRTLDTGAESSLLSSSILSQTRPAVSPDGRYMAYNWPGTIGWELRLMSLERPGESVLLQGRPRGRPLTPSWSADGASIYFTEADSVQALHLHRISVNGGAPSEVVVRTWDSGVPMGRLRIETGDAARLHVTDSAGHPLIPATGMPRFDGQNGLVYFYSPGSITLEVPAGTVNIVAARGLAAVAQRMTLTVPARGVARATLTLTPIWNASAAGWFSGDNHFHLNYGGQFDLSPTALELPMRGEALDVGTPMLANLSHRYEDQDRWGYRATAGRPMIEFAQEVRSHFLGHVGLIGTRELFWPWTWGPGYSVYARDDRTNAEPLAAARRQGGLGIYVHPVTVPDPFSAAGLSNPPIELVADAVLGGVDLLEIVCLWSNSAGTTELWYRLLNAGLAIMPSGGTDVMTDLHRTMAVGSTRVYVKPDGPLTWKSYYAALEAGHSFVTTGPMLELTVNGVGPGGVIRAGTQARVTLAVHSAMPLDSISIIVNGKVVAREPGADGPFSRTTLHTIDIPKGGWIAARVSGPATGWPSMAEQTFAHTAPIWIGARSSTDVSARQAAVADLIRLLDRSEQQLDAGYRGTQIPLLKARFAEARARLATLGR